MNDQIDRQLLADTIAAVSTPPGPSGIAVIRISGPAVCWLGDKLFEPLSDRFPIYSAMPGYTCAPGYWLAYEYSEDAVKKQRVDQVVVTSFRAPHSYTGEDVMEISCHGSTAVKQQILDSVFAVGASAAGPGEFTQRAFANGKIDLAQAEAVMDLISSEAKIQAQAAINQLQGSVSLQIDKADQAVYALLAKTELILEFPEHEETEENIRELANQISDVRAALELLTDSYRQGRILSEGLNVVIAGRPNAGKSSLLNQLAGYDRAIVTEIPGTTRDTVRETIDLGGIPVHITDTAGIRDSEDPVEKIGVMRARTAASQADLVVWLVSPPMDEEEVRQEIIEIGQLKSTGVPLILICGKEDLQTSESVRGQLQQAFAGDNIISFSAVSGEGLAQIRQGIINVYESSGSFGSESVILTNRRHLEAARSAVSNLDQAMKALQDGLTLDLTAMLLRSAAESLAEITGQSVSEEIVQAVFSRFCVGK